MPINRKNNKKTRKNNKKHKDAKQGTQIKQKLKTCRAKKYQSIYGVTGGGSIRSSIHSFY